MDRTKLSQKLQTEIKHYLDIPYFINSPSNPHQKHTWQVGKGNWRQIKKYTQTIATQKKVNLSHLNKQQFYNFQKKHHIGIDCSGLTYHLLDFIYHINYHHSIRSCLIGTENKTGPRRLSAHLLTSPPNAIPVTNKNNIQIGDLIRSDHGQHVMFIYKISKDKLFYIHSRRQNRKVCINTTTKYSSVYRLQCLTSLHTALHT